MPAAVRLCLMTVTLLLAAWPAEAAERRFVIAAVEPKGGTDAEPFPAAPLPEGGGYVLKAPDRNGRWEVSAYVWMPSQVTVNEGDNVTLEFVGINGAHHPTTIAGYERTLTVKRGQVTTVTFTADKAGVFAISCDTHRPSMVGELVVLPRR